MTVLVMNANDASRAFIECISISGSPQSEPIQKPKLISSSDVRAAVIASRSSFGGQPLRGLIGDERQRGKQRHGQCRFKIASE